jgi:3-oxoacyl-[acyl-carrier protein] reductase
MSNFSQDSKAYLQTQDLVGKIAFITGISKGIGRATATHLASRGCSVLGTCTSSSSQSLIDDLRDEVELLYRNASFEAPRIKSLILSLSDPDAANLVADYLSQHFDSRVDIFINNAAAVDRTPVGGLVSEDVANMCLCNIQTPAMIIDELVKRKFFRTQSRIIFISSAESTRCAPEA